METTANAFEFYRLDLHPYTGRLVFVGQFGPCEQVAEVRAVVETLPSGRAMVAEMLLIDRARREVRNTDATASALREWARAAVLNHV